MIKKTLAKIKNELKIFAFSVIVVPVCLIFRFYRKYLRKRRRYRTDWSDYENY